MSKKSLKGNSFLKEDSKDSQGNPKRHLYIVISDSDVDNRVLIVSLNTFKNNGREDTSCLLFKGDHSFIKQKSYIRYDRAEEIEEVRLLQLKLKGLIVLKEDISPKVLKRIQNGAKKSNALPRKFKKYFQYF